MKVRRASWLWSRANNTSATHWLCETCERNHAADYGYYDTAEGHVIRTGHVVLIARTPLPEPKEATVHGDQPHV